jgi:hypothetical protein
LVPPSGLGLFGRWRFVEELELELGEERRLDWWVWFLLELVCGLVLVDWRSVDATQFW